MGRPVRRAVSGEGAPERPSPAPTIHVVDPLLEGSADIDCAKFRGMLERRCGDRRVSTLRIALPTKGHMDWPAVGLAVGIRFEERQ